jgi:hypothetical protein
MLSICDAVLTDLKSLLSLEKDCFECERINRRQFRYLLIRNSARMLVTEDESGLLGYVFITII